MLPFSNAHRSIKGSQQPHVVIERAIQGLTLLIEWRNGAVVYGYTLFILVITLFEENADSFSFMGSYP